MRIALDDGLQGFTLVRLFAANPLPLRRFRLFLLPLQSLFRLAVQVSEALTRLIGRPRGRKIGRASCRESVKRGRPDVLLIMRRLALHMPFLTLRGGVLLPLL